MRCAGYPRPGTEGAGMDGITRADCICGRPITWIQDVPNRRDSWRHKPKVKVLR